MGEERFDLRSTHVARVSLAVKEYETTDPAEVLLLGAVAVVLQADSFSNTVEQAGFRIHAVFPIPIFDDLFGPCSIGSKGLSPMSTGLYRTFAAIHYRTSAVNLLLN